MMTVVVFVYITVGMVTKPSTEQSQDFSIHNEDFPALPGPNYKDPTLSTDESKSVSITHPFKPFSKPCEEIAMIYYRLFAVNSLELELLNQEQLQCRWPQVPR